MSSLRGGKGRDPVDSFLLIWGWAWGSGGVPPAEPRGHRRVGAMSKVELAGRPEPGYESMEQFSVSVEHVAEMLRTIDFQPGEGAEEGTV